MKLRGLLKWLNDALRPAHVAGGMQVERGLTSDKEDAFATFTGQGTAPTNWVPSQQDERPH